MSSYYTIEKSAEGFYKSKGSKFYGYAYPVFSKEDINASLLAVKQMHPKAGHHCYSWRLGMTDDLYRINDDGEPSGTAGKPIYGQIRSKNLRNILIIIVRYFGGTKLGVAGLISSYKSTAEQTLQNSSIIERNVKDYFSLQFDYTNLNGMMSLLKKSPVDIIEQNFENACFIKLSINLADREKLILALDKIQDLKYEHLFTA